MRTNTLVDNAGDTISRRKEIKLQIFCIHTCGHALTVLFAVAWLVCAQFLPAPSPLESAQQISARYVDNVHGIRVGVTLMMLGFGLWAPWGATIAAWTRKTETGRPVLTYIQLISLTIAEMVGLMCAFFWGVAAFRPGEISAEITMTLNDMGWLMFLIPWPPYSVWAIAVGMAILRDASEAPVFPRWVAGLSFLTAFLFVPAFAPLFFKTGGFAYDGLLGMFLPLLIFFVWVEGVTHAITKSLKRESRQCEAVGYPSGSGSASAEVHLNA